MNIMDQTPPPLQPEDSTPRQPLLESPQMVQLDLYEATPRSIPPHKHPLQYPAKPFKKNLSPTDGLQMISEEPASARYRQGISLIQI